MGRALAAAVVAAALAFATGAAGGSRGTPGLLVTADRVFDGHRVVRDGAVLVRGRVVVAVGERPEVGADGVRELALGDATVLPGIVDLHVHAAPPRLLRAGVTTVRNVGEPLASLRPPRRRPGTLRKRSSGPILTARGGYPSAAGWPAIAYEVRGAAQARAAVRLLVRRGATVIKLALENGGSGWPLLTVAEARAIVGEAHRLGREVTAHARGRRPLAIALAAAVDELAHMPCGSATRGQVARVAERRIPVVATLHVDEVYGCRNAVALARTFVAHGGVLLYGSDAGNEGIPVGIDLRELRLLEQAGLSRVEVLRAATSRAGRQAGVPRLGTLAPGAPADVIAVAGDPFRDLRALRRVRLVLAGGRRAR